jgi:hypothetical protein
VNSVSFDSNNLSKSCNVEFDKFEALNSEQQEQCFNYFKGVVVQYTVLNQQVENSFGRQKYRDAASTGMPVIPTITGGDGDSVNSMPPIPTVYGSMPPIPTVQGVNSMPPIPTNQVYNSMPPIPTLPAPQ